jgi:hypothetical protein
MTDSPEKGESAASTPFADRQLQKAAEYLQGALPACDAVRSVDYKQASALFVALPLQG